MPEIGLEVDKIEEQGLSAEEEANLKKIYLKSLV